jgi:hypothetical protein
MMGLKWDRTDGVPAEHYGRRQLLVALHVEDGADHD